MHLSKKFSLVMVFVMLLTVFAIPDVSHGTTDGKKAKYTIEMNKTVYTMKKGKTVTLKTTKNAAAKKKKVVWISSNKKIAAVNSKGKVKAKKNGKVTITARIKGTKVKTTCKITVGTPVSKVELNETAVSLQVGETFKLQASLSPKKPSNKNVTYDSSDENIARVSDEGLITAIAPGEANITVTAADGTGKKAECAVTVEASVDEKKATPTNPETTPTSPEPETPDDVDDNAVKTKDALEAALKDEAIEDIVFRSDVKEEITIPEGNYSAKTLTIDAPNADVVNYGSFEKVIIEAIAADTYKEHGDNKIDFEADKGHIKVESDGTAEIKVKKGKNNKDKENTEEQYLHLENEGTVTNLEITDQSQVRIDGSESVPVTLKEGAEDTSIITSTELDIKSEVKWDMMVLPGGEQTKAEVGSEEDVPDVEGIGRIPVTVTDENGAVADVVNVVAETPEDGNAAVSKRVTVSGNVQEHTLTNGTVKKIASANATVYLLAYKKNNANLTADNYEDYIKGNGSANMGNQFIGSTDSSGDYSITDVKIGNYWFIVVKDGFATVVKNIYIDSLQSGTYANGEVTLLSTGFSNAKVTSISGTIIDGLTGNSVGVAGITVKLRGGHGNVTGEARVTQTKSDGTYAFEESLDPGMYTLEVLDLRNGLTDDAVRYNSVTSDIVIAGGYLNATYNCVVDRIMYDDATGVEQVQFTLTWGTIESGASADIDSHLIGPAVGGGTFHTYYSNKVYKHGTGEEAERMADLDVDDVNYEGPEHTTIYKITDGIYRFYIHNFSELSQTRYSDKLARSQVQVKITMGNNTYVYNCPNEPGTLWYVCDYDSVTNTLIPKNEMSYNSSPSTIGK